MALNTKQKTTKQRNPFAGVGEAEVNESGNFLEEGTHVVDLTTHKIVDGFNGQFAVVEMEIVDSTREEYEPGLKRSWVVSLSKELAKRDLKAYLLAVYDGDLAEDDADAIDEAATELWSEEQPGTGIRMRVECRLNKAGTFTKHLWSRYHETKKKKPAR